MVERTLLRLSSVLPALLPAGPLGAARLRGSGHRRHVLRAVGGVLRCVCQLGVGGLGLAGHKSHGCINEVLTELLMSRGSHEITHVGLTEQSIIKLGHICATLKSIRSEESPLISFKSQHIGIIPQLLDKIET